MGRTLSVLTNQEVSRAINSYHESNRLSLEIYNYLLQRFGDSSGDFSPISNIFGLFFHDLMIHFSGIVIQREFVRQDKNEVVAFPFGSTKYARRPFIIDEQSYMDNSSKRNSVKKIWRTGGIVPLAVGEGVPLDIRGQWLMRKSLTLLGKYQPFCKAYLPHREQQIDALCEVVRTLAQRFEIPAEEHLIENWANYSRHHTSSVQSRIKDDQVILGTRAVLQNRKLAMNFLQQDKDVIAMTHGEITSTIFNEPLFGYAELGFCSTLIDYGDLRLDAPLHESLSKPNKFLSRTSVSVQKIQNRRNVRGASTKSGGGKKKILYIPTTYNEKFHYGPYRGFEDGLYLKWQSELIAAVPELTIKPHPKCIRPPFDCRQDERALQRCYLDYDVIILDYYSTAATLMIATDKPVIFFDIGLRNLVPDFKLLLKQRCDYVQIDWALDLSDQIRRSVNVPVDHSSVAARSKFSRFSIVTRSSDDWRGIRWIPYKGIS